LPENLHDIDDELLVKHLLRETNAAEDQAVEAWLSRADGNRAYYAHFKLIWEESKHLAAVSRVSEEEAWSRFHKRIKNDPKVRRIPARVLLRIAASIILIVGSFVLGYIFFGGKEVHQVAVVSLERPMTDTLPDGSVITLNKRSQLSYPSAFTGNTRPISLKGEAFFKVTPDKKKPFIISVNDVSIRVVGTTFNVKEENGNTEVTVQTGVVQVTRNGHMVELRPEQRVSAEKDETTLVKDTVTDRLYDYYQSREFVCDNTPLWKLVDVLNEAYDVNIRIGREELKKLPLTTTFDNESLETILNIVSTTFKLTVERKGNEIILK
jgi:transmembrane sensor